MVQPISCYSCKVIRGDGAGFQKPEYIFRLGKWVVNHCGGEGTYLGRLILQTESHRPEFDSLDSTERAQLGDNIVVLNAWLREYFDERLKDPIERVHLGYLNETPYFHGLTGLQLENDSLFQCCLIITTVTFKFNIYW